jgi:fibronectin-binding autotransporter adhesin
MANFPNSVTTFANRTSGQTIASAHMNAVQDEINALEDGYLNGTARLNSSNSTVANLSVTGGSTLGSLTLSTGMTMNGPLTVSSGGVTISTGGLTVTGGITVSSGGMTVSTGTTVLGGPLRLAGGSTVSLSGGSTTFNDIAVPDDNFICITSGSTNVLLTGLSGGTHGRIVYLTNIAGGTITLAFNNAGSSVGNRFLSTGAIALATNMTVPLIYSTRIGAGDPFWCVVKA